MSVIHNCVCVCACVFIFMSMTHARGKCMRCSLYLPPRQTLLTALLRFSEPTQTCCSSDKALSISHPVKPYLQLYLGLVSPRRHAVVLTKLSLSPTPSNPTYRFSYHIHTRFSSSKALSIFHPVKHLSTTPHLPPVRDPPPPPSCQHTHTHLVIETGATASSFKLGVDLVKWFLSFPKNVFAFFLCCATSGCAKKEKKLFFTRCLLLVKWLLSFPKRCSLFSGILRDEWLRT